MKDTLVGTWVRSGIPLMDRIPLESEKRGGGMVGSTGSLGGAMD